MKKNIVTVFKMPFFSFSLSVYLSEVGMHVKLTELSEI